MDSYWTATNRRINAVFKILPSMARHIEEFVLHSWHIEWHDGHPTTPPLFSGSAPRLRVLSIVQLSFVPTDHFPDLQELYITLRNTPKLPQLPVNMLRGSPMLKYVHISAPHLRVPPDGAPNDRVRASLPRLRAIVLCIGHNTSSLLSDLVLPPSCLVRIQLEDAFLSEVSPCLEALEMHLDAGPLTKLSWSTGTSMGFTMNHKPTHDMLYITLCNATADSGLQLGISLPVPRSRSRARSVFADVLRGAITASPLYANVTELSVSAERNLVDSTLLDSLHSLTTINHIFSAALARSGAIGARTRRRRRDTPRVPLLARAGGPDGALVCPALHTLYFIGCGAAELRDARDILQARKEAGRPLTRLGIDCSARLREDVGALGGLVDELDVAFTDEPGYEEVSWSRSVLKGGWRSHSARARYEWPQWSEFHE
ncbi:hypothetical protein TRAPUB_5427 [Trametes pubescens]|uniref:F-box domain-containing protein n=1 Tax=Trametes pubescens TaxID=154538 RepID=A0A1M2V8E9_TRAPU|nr:hypothetical protein TRAPUB_5427 [Trametes pubescens]